MRVLGEGSGGAAPNLEGLTIGEAALAWARAGFYVFPCIAVDYDQRKQKWSKRPHPMLDEMGAARGEGGWKLATRVAAQVEAWWTSDPEALIGIPPGMSGAVVLDADGPEGVSQLYARAGDAFDLYTTFQSRTPGDGGGLHVWFLRDPKAEKRTVGNGKLAHIRGEARADRGYVIVPPSTLPDGGTYQVASHTNVLAVLNGDFEWVTFELPWETGEFGARAPIADITTGEQTAWLDRHSWAARINGDNKAGRQMIEDAKAALRGATPGDSDLGRDPTMKHWVGALLTAAQNHQITVDLPVALGEILDVFLEVKPQAHHDFQRFLGDALALRVAEDRAWEHSYIKTGELDLRVLTPDEEQQQQLNEQLAAPATRVTEKELPEPVSPSWVPDLPPHLRLYEDGEVGGLIAALSDAVLIGPLGEWLAAVEPETEASLASLGAGALTALSAWYGRDYTLKVGNMNHPPRLFAVQVGPTGEARKGTADGEILRFLKALDLEFWSHNVVSGFGSGEAIVETLSDPRRNAEGDLLGGREDQRVWVLEAEFSKMLRIANRDGQVLGDVIRLGFDGRQPIENRTKAKTLTSSRHAIGTFGGITPEELTELFPALAAVSGTGNRYLWVWSNPQKYLPDGGRDVGIDSWAKAIRVARADLQRRGITELDRTPEAIGWWRHMYRELRSGSSVPTRVRPMAGRTTDLVQRIAMIYALTEGASHVSVRHLEAGLAWVEHSISVVANVLAGVIANPVAARILVSIRQHPGVPVSLTEMHRVFARNETASAIHAALAALEAAGLVHRWRESSGGGRPVELTVATMPISLEKAPRTFFTPPPQKSQSDQSGANKNKYEKSVIEPQNSIVYKGGVKEVPEEARTPEEALAQRPEEALGPEGAPVIAMDEATAEVLVTEAGADLIAWLQRPNASPQIVEETPPETVTRVSEHLPAPTTSSFTDRGPCPECGSVESVAPTNRGRRCQTPGCEFASPEGSYQKWWEQRR